MGRSETKPNVPIADKLLLTLAEAQALTGLSKEFLRDAIASGDLKAKVSRPKSFPEALPVFIFPWECKRAKSASNLPFKHLCSGWTRMAIAYGRDRQPQKRRLKSLFFRQFSKVFGLLKVIGRTWRIKRLDLEQYIATFSRPKTFVSQRKNEGLGRCFWHRVERSLTLAGELIYNPIAQNADDTGILADCIQSARMPQW